MDTTSALRIKFLMQAFPKVLVSAAAAVIQAFLQLPPHIPVRHLLAPPRFPAAIPLPCVGVLRVKHLRPNAPAVRSLIPTLIPAAATAPLGTELRRFLPKFDTLPLDFSLPATRIAQPPSHRVPTRKIPAASAR